MSEQRVFFLQAADAGDGYNVTGYGLWPETATLDQVSDSGTSGMAALDVPRLFRAAHDLALRKEHEAGFPTFATSGDRYSGRMSVVLIRRGLAQVALATAKELSCPNPEIAIFLFRAARDWARSRGMEHGFPTFHLRETDRGPAHEIVSLTKEVAAGWRRFPLARGVHSEDSVARTFASCHANAVERGFVGAIPNFWGNDNYTEISDAEWRLNRLLEEGWRIKSVDAMRPQGADRPEAARLSAVIVLER